MPYEKVIWSYNDYNIDPGKLFNKRCGETITSTIETYIMNVKWNHGSRPGHTTTWTRSVDI